MGLAIEVHQSDSSKVTLELRGGLDTHTTPQLEETLVGLKAEKCPLLVLDLSQLEYISSAGMRCIFKARKEREAYQGRLLLVNLRTQVHKVFSIMKAIPEEEIFSSLAELDRYLDNLQK